MDKHPYIFLSPAPAFTFLVNCHAYYISQQLLLLPLQVHLLLRSIITSSIQHQATPLAFLCWSETGRSSTYPGTESQGKMRSIFALLRDWIENLKAFSLGKSGRGGNIASSELEWVFFDLDWLLLICSLYPYIHFGVGNLKWMIEGLNVFFSRRNFCQVLWNWKTPYCIGYEPHSHRNCGLSRPYQLM